MLELSSDVKIVKKGLLLSEGIDFIFDLYLPLIGSDATFLYLFLLRKVNSKKMKFEDLVNESLLSFQNFLLAKKSLESIALISTFKKKDEDSYVITINGALSPKNFFDNLVLKGLFIQSVGEEKANEILKTYVNNINLKNYDDISAKVSDSFAIDFNPKFANLDEGLELEGVNKNVIKDDFSDVKLLNYLKKNTQIRVTSLSEDEFDFIHKVATLYGLSEKDIGGLVSECFIIDAPKGQKLDKIKLKRIAKTYVRSYKSSTNKTERKTTLNSTSDVASLIKYYESISPRKFLMSKQNNVEISEADKNILEELSFDMGLSNGIINALLDYVLKQTNGELSKNYISKIATTLIRKGCKNTLDCLNLLSGATKKNKNITSKYHQEDDKYKTIDIDDLENDEDYKIFEGDSFNG